MRPLVMVIDDSLTIRKILEICLQRAGYRVALFEDGVAALRWLAEPGSAIPAVVLVDLGLPRLDGYTVIKLLKTRPGLDSIVIVILSARDGILDRIKGRLVGAHAYVTKPFRTHTILALLEMHLGVAHDEDHATESYLPDQPLALAASHQTTQGGNG